MTRRQLAWASGRRRGLWIGAATIVLSVLSLAPYATTATDVVRMRNALLVVDGPSSDFDWTPATRPAGLAVDPGPPDALFAAAVNRLQLDTLTDDWARAVAISEHLLTSSKTLVGEAIQADLDTTYRRIVERGDGYCADFVRIFSAMAITAGIPVRSWAFSFDGFGGHGHVMPEIWNRQLGRWQMLDVFNNYAVVDTSGRPLSAQEFQRALLAETTTVQLRPLVVSARPGYIHEEKVWAYYRAGAPQWYLWWGDQAFAYDRAWGVRSFEGGSRSLAQLGAIIQGVHPRIRILATAQNAPQVAALRKVRVHLLIVAGLIAVAVVGMAACAGGAAVMRVRRRGRHPERAEIAARS